MREKHTTKEGVTMHINQMDDDHLFNTIKLRCEGIEKTKAILNGGGIVNSDPFKSALYGVSTEKVEKKLKDSIPKAFYNLSYYLVEAVFRPAILTKVSTLVTNTFGRSGREDGFDGLNFDGTPALNPSSPYDPACECGYEKGCDSCLPF